MWKIVECAEPRSASERIAAKRRIGLNITKQLVSEALAPLHLRGESASAGAATDDQK